MNTYLPGVSLTDSDAVAPAAMSSTSSTCSTPAPSSSAAGAPSSNFVGRLAGSASVLRITNSWTDGPAFLMEKVTAPAATDGLPAAMAKSFTVTPTAVPAPPDFVFGLPPPHAAAVSATTAATARIAVMLLVRPMLLPSDRSFGGCSDARTLQPRTVRPGRDGPTGLDAERAMVRFRA